MRRAAVIVVIAAAAALLPGPARAGALACERHRLDNGLEVILRPVKGSGVTAVSVWYHVGAGAEPAGRTGFAHLFEHLMFDGSEHLEAGRHGSLVFRAGGWGLNGTTDYERTAYFEVMPTYNLEVALWAEADRMGFLLPAVDQKTLDLDKEIVKSERRLRVDNQRLGAAQELLWKALFPAPHPFHGMVIGSMKDLDAATLEDVQAFFTRWYAPSNATLVLVGDFEPKKALSQVKKYFGELPALPKPEAPAFTPARLEGETVLHHEAALGRDPALLVGWHAPAVFTEGDAEAVVLREILATGRASRLHRRLVREKALAADVAVIADLQAGQSAFEILAEGVPGVDPKALLAEIDAALDEVRAGQVTEREIARAVAHLDTEAIAALDGVGGLLGQAELMQYYNQHLGDPDRLGWDMDRYRKVTPASLARFAREVLDPARRVVVDEVPAGATKTDEGAASAAAKTDADAAPAPAKEAAR